MFKIAIFASGRGSNLQALWDASQKPDSHFEVVAVLSDKPDCAALQFAESKGIPTYAANGDKASMESQWLEQLQNYQPDLICLAGFMRILSPQFVQAWQGKIINIHPSLLPKYKGLDTHARALAAGDKQHGATVHYVTERLDDGDIIAQCRIATHSDDTADKLAARLLPLEHKLYAEAVKKLAQKLAAIHKN